MALSNFDRRSTTGDSAPVALRVVEDIVVPAGGYAVREDIDDINGTTVQLHFIVPDLDAADTVTLTIYDGDGNTIYVSAGLAESTRHAINVERPFIGPLEVLIVCSGTQAAARTFSLYIYYV